LNQVFRHRNRFASENTLAIVVAIIHGGSNCGKPSRRFPNISGTRRQVPEISVTDDGAAAKLKIILANNQGVLVDHGGNPFKAATWKGRAKEPRSDGVSTLRDLHCP
jgi:hypothetical protein